MISANNYILNKKEKSDFIVSKLGSLYPNPPIPLNHTDSFTLLVAVLLSARCTDKRVNQVTPELFALANNPYDMMRCKVSEIKNIIKPCGLSPFKSKAIRDLSIIICAKHSGNVPNNFDELEELPGVGHKTASVVMTQAFNIPTFPVDTHIHRLCYRWGLSNGKNVTNTEKDCKKVFPKYLWGKLHLQMIFFGREFCQARVHNPRSCPICSKIGRKSLFI